MRAQPFHTAMTVLLDALFPKRCLGCRVFDTWLCDRCHTTLPLRTEQQCPICKKRTTPDGVVCPRCAPHTPLRGVYVASSYRDQLLKTTIHYFKYRFVAELSAPLALLLAQGVRQSHLPAPDIIMPVPLHPRRLRWRGFNQATLLAQQLDLTIALSTDNLIRTRYTTPQVNMRTKRRREQNLAQAFALTSPAEVRGQNILLIDDITTTGATLTHCATVLKDAGAQSVSGLVIARE